MPKNQAKLNQKFSATKHPETKRATLARGGEAVVFARPALAFRRLLGVASLTLWR